MDPQTVHEGQSILNWLSGGDHQYKTLAECLNHDVRWLSLIVVVNMMIATGHILVAVYWHHNKKRLGNSPASVALGRLRDIFACTGLCFFFMPIGLFWPAWRLWVALAFALACFTWQYVLRANNVSYVYSEARHAKTFADELVEVRDSLDVLLLQPEIEPLELQQVRDQIDNLISEA